MHTTDAMTTITLYIQDHTRPGNCFNGRVGGVGVMCLWLETLVIIPVAIGCILTLYDFTSCCTMVRFLSQDSQTAATPSSETTITSLGHTTLQAVASPRATQNATTWYSELLIITASTIASDLYPSRSDLHTVASRCWNVLWFPSIGRGQAASGCVR